MHHSFGAEPLAPWSIRGAAVWLAAGLVAAVWAAGATQAVAQEATEAQTTEPESEEVALPELGSPQPFSFETLKARARALAAEPFVPYDVQKPEELAKIDYDAHWRIVFRDDATVEVGDVPLQFFHLGRFFREPVKMHVVENGQSREIVYGPQYFDIPEDSPALAMEDVGGFAGFRIMREGLQPDWISFLGAAYFRTDGPDAQYGLSARALAIDTGLGIPEEFPRFTEFYVEDGPEHGADTIIYALLDGPSVAGAYRMAASNDDGQVIDVSSALYFRQPVQRLGIAPMTSMYWYSEGAPVKGFDWRPEIHDSDGLALATGTGESIWRPLNNPDVNITSAFVDPDIRGFGLLQRDRDFDHYQDDGVFYDRRPSVWIEPRGDWGPGEVQLVELANTDEIFDNIVAYWQPAELPVAGTEMNFDYRMYWGRGLPHASPLARTVATRVGNGGIPGQPRPENEVKYVIDFDGERLQGLTQADAVEPDVSVGPGARLVRAHVLPIVGTEQAWRLTFDVELLETDHPVDVRAYLRHDGDALTETWLGQIHPAQVVRRRGGPVVQ